MSSPPDDPRVEFTPFAVRGPPIFMRRGKHSRTGKPVLLIHGASASCDTFLQPEGDSLFDYLNIEKGYDVWLFDWRGSLYATAANPSKSDGTVDDVASFDIPHAIEYVRAAREAEGSAEKIAVVAHCMGAACLSMAIGARHVSTADIRSIVLSAIGLFYEMAWDGWAKLQDRILERVADANPDLHSISPHETPWPKALEDAYSVWPKTWGPVWTDDFFRRLAFLYGQAFMVSNLHPKMDREEIRKHFGAVPFKFYRHGAQNILRGFAACVDAEGQIDPATPNHMIEPTVAKTYMNLDAFRGLDITLITGAENTLWHRDSIDRMAEWLSRGDRRPTKHVLDGYGHQDLWWGRHSRRDVFPLVLRAIQ